MIKLYSTGCPRCSMLKKKLDAAGIDYVVETDVQPLLDKGLKTVPILDVDGEYLTFEKAWKWASK